MILSKNQSSVGSFWHLSALPPALPPALPSPPYYFFSAPLTISPSQCALAQEPRVTAATPVRSRFRPRGRVSSDGVRNTRCLYRMTELEPELGDLDSLLMSLVSEEGPPRTDDSETIRVDDLLVDEAGLPLALDVETRKARWLALERSP